MPVPRRRSLSISTARMSGLAELLALLDEATDSPAGYCRDRPRGRLLRIATAWPRSRARRRARSGLRHGSASSRACGKPSPARSTKLVASELSRRLSLASPRSASANSRSSELCRASCADDRIAVEAVRRGADAVGSEHAASLPGESHGHGVPDADGECPVPGHPDGNVAPRHESPPRTTVALLAQRRGSCQVRTDRSTCSNAARARRRDRCPPAIVPAERRRQHSIG